MWEKAKAFLWWVYEWVTVIGAVVIGGAASVLPYLDMLAAVDLASILPATIAVKIVAGIGLFKWLCVVSGAIRAWLTAEVAT